jgi:hypothetical protein
MEVGGWVVSRSAVQEEAGARVSSVELRDGATFAKNWKVPGG